MYQLMSTGNKALARSVLCAEPQWLACLTSEFARSCVAGGLSNKAKVTVPSVDNLGSVDGRLLTIIPILLILLVGSSGD